MTFHGRIPTIDVHADAVMITYYPFQQGTDFQVHSIEQVGQDISGLVASTGSKPIYVLEAGAPSGSDCASSQTYQAEFVDEIFRQWDLHLDRIPLVLFNWLVDIPQTQVDAYINYYGINSAGFRCFLGTLGLMGESGGAKEALNTLRANVKDRN